MAALRYVFKHRFSYFDLVPITIAANLFGAGRWAAALFVLLIGSFVAIMGKGA